MPSDRCSDWAFEAAVDPIGTATSADGWLLIEWPQPWPADAREVPALAPVHEALRNSRLRLQLVVPDPDSVVRHVTLYALPKDSDGWFAGYEPTVRAVHPDDVVAATLALLGGGAGNVEPPGQLALICSHGSRDRCCGSRGTSLAVGAAASGLAVRRTSHTGGHRFAPTGVVLPGGTAWAFLDDDSFLRLTKQTGSLDDLLPRYRGSSAMGSPGLQALERSAFGEIGWSWLRYRRRGTDLGDGMVRIDAVAPSGTRIFWEGQSGQGRVLPVPDCGRPIEHAAKFEAEVTVRTTRRRVPVDLT